MPPKNSKGKKSNGYNKRKSYKSKLGRPSRGLTQSTYFFTRKKSNVIKLSDTTLSDGWNVSSDNGIYKDWNFNLSELTDYTDFTALFKQYKICAVQVELTFNNTGSVVSANDGSTASIMPGTQLQLYTIPNRVGKARGALSPLTEAIVLNTQASKKRLALNGGRPLKYYMKLNQLGEIFNTSINTDYVVTRPRYISTDEVNTKHYGMEMYLNRVDGVTLSSDIANEQVMRETITYYIACKGVE
ncbi:MAG: capsid protein [Circular genetic element sp.]|nr:MAG: capsid protein [Circular genetic element sp.]